jgi:hypothetical protein
MGHEAMKRCLASSPRDRHPGPTSPEQTILLACAFADRHRASATLAQALPKVGDWNALRGAALHHGVAALLYKRIVESGSTATPPEQLEALRALANAGERRGLRMGAQLLGLLELLSREQIEAFPVKGPVMAEALYGDVGLRNFVDLDIAMRPRDVTTAREVLLAAGFQQITGVGIESDRLLASECEMGFKNPDRGIVLDLHWQLGPRFAHASLPVADLMANTRTTTFLGRDLLTLSREDLFVVMCVHGSHSHRWDSLELVAALGAWGAEAAESDWLPLLERAARLGCLRRCTIGCLLMRDVTGCALPADIESRLARDTLAARLADGARAAMFAGGLQTSPKDGLGGIVWESLALDKPTLMLAHFVARVFTPGTWDWEFGLIPRHLPRLYYLSRPLRLALGRFGRGGPE